MATCDFRFSLQNRYAEDSFVDDLAELQVSNRAVTISGRATMSEKDISRTDFIDAKPQELRERLKDFLEKNGLPRTNDLVILDMEPKEISPRQLGDFEDDKQLQRDLIAAYRRRIDVARQVLRETKLRGLKLGLYQVIVPDGKGRSTSEFKQSMRGYCEAGAQGMYDQLDAICPVLYQRFGPADAGPETLRTWLDASAKQGIDKSLTLSRRNRRVLPLIPLLSFWVFNGNSGNNRDTVKPERLARQLKIVQAAVRIDAIVFWSGWQTPEEMKKAGKPVEEIVIRDFLDSVGSLPWPGCT